MSPRLDRLLTLYFFGPLGNLFAPRKGIRIPILMYHSISDEKETGHRRVLNLGHTVGHALERLSGYEIRHGDAVAMGLVAATKLAVSLGKFETGDLVRLEKLCQAWGLPVRVPSRFPPEAVLAAMQTDKKHIRGRLHFMLPVRVGEVLDYQDLDVEQLGEMLGQLREG